jgi:hypothetical protein
VSCRLRCLLRRTWWRQTAQSRSLPSGERMHTRSDSCHSRVHSADMLNASSVIIYSHGH